MDLEEECKWDDMCQDSKWLFFFLKKLKKMQFLTYFPIDISRFLSPAPVFLVTLSKRSRNRVLFI